MSDKQKIKKRAHTERERETYIERQRQCIIILYPKFEETTEITEITYFPCTANVLK